MVNFGHHEARSLLANIIGITSTDITVPPVVSHQMLPRIGDKIKSGQFLKCLPRQGTAEWWTWLGKLNQIAAVPEESLIADI